MVHDGLAAEIPDQRRRDLTAAFQQHPEGFVRKPPRPAVRAHLVSPRMRIGEQTKERARAGRIVTATRTPPVARMAVQPVSDGPGRELSYLLEPGFPAKDMPVSDGLRELCAEMQTRKALDHDPDEAEIGRLRGSRGPLFQTRIGAGPGSNPGRRGANRECQFACRRRTLYWGLWCRSFSSCRGYGVGTTAGASLE
jgi:hypothetical protein